MAFTDGTSQAIELSPPETYGIEVSCIDNGSVRSSYTYEADHGVFNAEDGGFENRQFLFEYYDYSCDEIRVRANLGQGSNWVGATAQRMYYSTSTGSWAAAGSAWYPDMNRIISDGLSGYTRELIFDDVWPDNNWLVADGVGSGTDYGDRKTVLRLYDGALNTLRIVEVVPY